MNHERGGDLHTAIHKARRQVYESHADWEQSLRKEGLVVGLMKGIRHIRTFEKARVLHARIRQIEGDIPDYEDKLEEELFTMNRKAGWIGRRAGVVGGSIFYKLFERN